MRDCDVLRVFRGRGHAGALQAQVERGPPPPPPRASDLGRRFVRFVFFSSSLCFSLLL